MVSVNEVLEINTISGDPGKKVDIDEVLLVSKKGKAEIGKPLVKDAKVKVEIVEHVKGDKTQTNKFKAKSRYRKASGHRQTYTVIKVVSI